MSAPSRRGDKGKTGLAGEGMAEGMDSIQKEVGIGPDCQLPF